MYSIYLLRGRRSPRTCALPDLSWPFLASSNDSQPWPYPLCHSFLGGETKNPACCHVSPSTFRGRPSAC